ncbi:VRR-NUC domain-containing protein [Coniochaeta sp. 2T2.1]|nr:VRR-NUC domain-containing protein [Coniochaeta sp. 2T2.1]
MDRFIQCSRPGQQARQPLAVASSNSARHNEAVEPPSKKRKVTPKHEIQDSDAEYSDNGESDIGDSYRKSRPVKGGDGDDVETSGRVTEIESALPSIEIGKDAIQEYENLRASQIEEENERKDESKPAQRKWVRGKSSIYVDAFNLALDTVLEDETHLFHDREREVFNQWRALDYEAQYLYVRLFLRKTASWHRVEKLGYHSDISDLERAVNNLLEAHDLQDSAGDPPTDETAPVETQEWSLGDNFTFADASENFINTMEEAVTLLSLDELRALAKEAKVQGKNKADITKALCRMSSKQAGLLSLGLRRRSTHESNDSPSATKETKTATLRREDSNRDIHFLTKILAITGPLIRLSEPVFKLFERVHFVFYRSTEWTEKSLTTIILAKISRRNFPSYIVCRSNIFPSRRHLLEFEHSVRTEQAADQILEFNGPPGAAGFQKVLDIFESIAGRWREALAEEQRKEDNVYEFGEGAYLRRFTAAHAYTRVAHKAAHVLGRLHRYREEHELLSELLAQRLFHPARRGWWYTRKALLEEHYMWAPEDDGDYHDTGSDAPANTKPGRPKTKPKAKSSLLDRQKQHWYAVATQTCSTALQDPDTHLIYHYDLQKRLVKLERKLPIPKRQQHDFGHVRLRAPEEHTVIGTQLVRAEALLPGAPKPGTPGAPSTKTIWLDELTSERDEKGNPPRVSVEEMCLSHYRSRGWKGYHSEGGILRTLFAYLFFDILFIYVPNVFQTAFQTCPLDLHSDAFYPARASEINHRLVEIENGAAADIIRAVDAKERERRTCVVGLNWDFELEDLVELVSCFDGAALASVCKVMAQEYRARGGGVPDLVLWRTGGEEDGQEEGKGEEEDKKQKGEVMFAEVKSANDRLSDTQRLWIHVLTGAGVRVALCNAVANEVKVLEGERIRCMTPGEASR